MSLTPKTISLLLIDTQVNMFEDTPAVAGADALLERLGRLLALARAAHVPILYVQNCGTAGQPDEPGTPGWELHPALAPRQGEPVIQKNTTDAFAGTALHQELTACGIQHLVIAGLQTEQCIADTSRRANELGYAVTLVADGHSTFDDGDRSAGQIIAEYNERFGAYATLTSVAEVVL